MYRDVGELLLLSSQTDSVSDLGAELYREI